MTYESTSSFTIVREAFGDRWMTLGFLDPLYSNPDGFGALTFSMIVEHGLYALSWEFNTFEAAYAFFDDTALSFGGFGNLPDWGEDRNLDIEFTLRTSGGSGGYFSPNFVVAAVPEPALGVLFLTVAIAFLVSRRRVCAAVK